MNIESEKEIVMENKKNNLNKEISNIEDSTKYGEFISSFFSWNTLEGQKEKAKYLENITKDKSEEKIEKKKNKEK